MSAPILSPSFRWIPAASHSDVSAFAERQRARIKAAQQRKPTKPNRAAEARETTIRG